MRAESDAVGDKWGNRVERGGMKKVKGRSFEVVRGGRFLPTPSVLAFGMDEDPLSERELCALRWARDAGYAIAVFAGRPAAPLRAQLAERDIRATVLVDDEGPASEPDSALTPAAARAEALARFCARWGATLEQTVVIAVTPRDCEAMMGAGRALALHGSGIDAAMAAEQTFLDRAMGGLARALNAAVAMRV